MLFFIFSKVGEGCSSGLIFVFWSVSLLQILPSFLSYETTIDRTGSVIFSNGILDGDKKPTVLILSLYSKQNAFGLTYILSALL